MQTLKLAVLKFFVTVAQPNGLTVSFLAYYAIEWCLHPNYSLSNRIYRIVASW